MILVRAQIDIALLQQRRCAGSRAAAYRASSMSKDVKIGLVLPTREAAMAGRPEVGPLLQLAGRI